MHEMSLAESILQLIEEARRREGFQRVTAVWLEIGRLAAVEPEAMRFCFDAVSQGSIMQGARLEILDLPGQGWCASCAKTVAMNESPGACPECGGYGLRVTGGTEMRVKELQVE